MISLVERAFIKRALLEGRRADGRHADDHREVHFEFHAQDRGHVIVHLGKTKYAVAPGQRLTAVVVGC